MALSATVFDHSFLFLLNILLNMRVMLIEPQLYVLRQQRHDGFDLPIRSIHTKMISSPVTPRNIRNHTVISFTIGINPIDFFLPPWVCFSSSNLSPPFIPFYYNIFFENYQ